MEPAWSPGIDSGSTTSGGTEQVGVPFRILGPLEVRLDTGPLKLGGKRPPSLLARLLLSPGRIVSTDQLIDALWDDDPPDSAEVTLRSHVASLRRALLAGGLEASVITRSPGYLLRVTPRQVDAQLFELRVAEGTVALQRGDAEPAARLLREALRLWRGPLLQDLGPPRFAEAEGARLEKLRLSALEVRIAADLALGRHRELAGELEPLVNAHPFHEQFYAQLMLALYRSDRQAEALEIYQLARRRLNQELGLEPGRTLVELEAAILRHDNALRPAPAGAAGSSLHRQAGDRPSASATATLVDLMRRQPIVGRTEELERLRAPWRAVLDGGCRIVLLSGEAGVGKTRLAAELAAEAIEHGASVLVGHCEQSAAIPYAPIIDALQASAEVEDAYKRASAPLRNLLAGLVERLWESPDGNQIPAGDAQEGRAAFFTAARELIASVAGRAPVLFMVEDAEALDAASARLLRHLARRLPERLLLLICFRDPPGSRHAPLRELVAALGRSGAADRVVLGPLPEPELAELIAAWTGRPAAARFVRALWSSTGGNPFYAGAVVEELMARGGIDETEAAWRVPTGVRDVLRERLCHLSPAAREVIRCAAVLGREVEFDLLVKVAGRPEPELVGAVEEATEGGWLVETARAWDAGYAFRHALMREAVHADLAAPDRQHLHLKAAEALEQRGLNRPADIASAAVHLRSSGPLGDRERAARLSLQAADAVAALYAWEEAATHAKAAVAILAGINASPATQADAARHTAELLTASTLDLPGAVQHFESALAHLLAAGDGRAIAEVRSRLGYVQSLHHAVMDIPRALEHFAAAEAILTAGEEAFNVQFGKVQATMFGLRTQQGVAASERAVELALELGRRDLVALVRPAEAYHRFAAGQLGDAHALISEAWEVARDIGDPRLAWDVTTSGAMLSSVYLLDPGTSRAWCERAFSQPRFESLTLPFEGMTDWLVYALALMGDLDAARDRAARLPDDAVASRHLLLLEGCWEAAERSWSAALDHDLGHGDQLNAVLNAYWMGQARWLLGCKAKALKGLEDALKLCLGGPQVPGELMVRAEMARYLAADGDVGDALVHLARCDEILGEGEDWRGRAGDIELARAAVAGAQGRHEDADAAHARALQVYTTFRLPWRRAEALLIWAGQLANRGNMEDATAKYQAACHAYDKLGAPARWQRPLATA